MADRALSTPVHVGRIGDADVRFFRGPSGSPEMPWHSVEDLYQALNLPGSLRRQMLRMTQAHWGKELRTVATADGPVVIGPHFVAQGLIGAAVEAMGGKPSLEIEYAKAGAEALKRLAGDRPAMATVEFAIAAYRKTHNVDGGEQ